MTTLEINDLSVVLGDRLVLSKLNLKIESGKFAAILGPSGCGKTTLLRSIAGLITPYDGAIRFGKQLVSVSSLVLPPHKRNIGYVPQDGGLFPHLSVYENVCFSLKNRKNQVDKNQIVHEMLELVGMKGYEKRLPQELSGGQQTRIALARALAMKPAIVLLDEPFSALDQALRNEISIEVVSLLKNTHTTSVMVTHDREDALVSADTIALMNDGKVVQYGAPADVYLNPISAEAALSTGDIDTFLAIKNDDGTFDSILHDPNFNPNNFSKESVGKLLVRPEEIKISRQIPETSTLGTISKINYYGHDAVIEIVAGSYRQIIRSRVTGVIDFKVGERVAVGHLGPIRWVSN
jgi:iron(III) transport system ATP-binding protein